jgi:hypothetical protein
MRYHEIFESESSDTLKLPNLKIGDEILAGKFKNRKATIKGFSKDDHNQPVLKTNKGDQKLFKPRIVKLMAESESHIDSTLLQDVDMSSYESFNKSLSKIPREQLMQLSGVLDQMREKIRKPHAGYIELYHGAPQKHAEDIRKNGFKITKGKRSGGITGLEYEEEVDNQGIFLTDSKPMAQFFGSNRSDYENDWKMFTCYVDSTKIVSSDNMALDIKRVGLRLINDYNGSKLKSIADRDWFWLLDQTEIVNMIKNKGYTGVQFREGAATKRLAGVKDGHTYLIFDPASIQIKERDGMTIKDFYEWLARQ